jgi:putative restriction endonuclease
VKGIFDTKANSGYDDEIVRRYHFPPQYRMVAAQLIGDWIIYREPQRNGGRRAYIAVARVMRIETDTLRAGYSYAVVADYLPLRPAGAICEQRRLRRGGIARNW